MTINDLISRLQYEAERLPRGLDSELGFATGPHSNAEILSFYADGDKKLWVDIGEPE